MITRDDQRNFIRMAVNSNVEIRFDDDEGEQQVKGICRDLSATGMSIDVDVAIPEGSQIRVHMDTGGVVPALQATCKVIRCSDIEPGQYHLGCEIIEMV
ncbi:MAG: PilZ domain-containing protein [Idiomarina sp.]